jgi:hypothetical protein
MAAQPTKGETLEFLGTVLEPVIRLMLRTGVSWKEFSELAKAKFVEVATADFGIRGRPTNVSRAAILTGLDRRDVKKLRDAVGAPPTKGYQSKASQILSAWHHDKEFLDAQGRAAVLPIEGGSSSFAALVQRYAPALPIVAVIKELKNAKAIEELPNGGLRPLSRTYVPRGLPAERLRLWASVLSDVANTIEHNLSRDERSTPARFERRALNLRIDPDALPEFRALVEEEGQAFLERIDDWLAAHEIRDADPGASVRLGIGIYHIEDRKRGKRKPVRKQKSPGDSK